MFFEVIFDSIHPIHKAGYKYIAVALCSSSVAFAYSWGLGSFCLLATIVMAYFFRDPRRSFPKNLDSVIISPADGIISSIETVPSIHDPEINVFRIAIRMTIMDVHINRCPMNGRIIKSNYCPGRIVVPASGGSTSRNERMELTLESSSGYVTSVVQIAGFIARRVVCYVEDGDFVQAGYRFGLIKFSSRVDVYLPYGISPQVRPGQTMVGAETIMAYLPESHDESLRSSISCDDDSENDDLLQESNNI